MKYNIVIADTAKSDIRSTVEWWSKNRSSEQAEQWYNKITPAIDTLNVNPELCPLSPETELVPTGLRQLHFGVSKKTTHRIVFTIDGNNVVIMRVRHVARRSLRLEDLI